MTRPLPWPRKCAHAREWRGCVGMDGKPRQEFTHTVLLSIFTFNFTPMPHISPSHNSHTQSHQDTTHTSHKPHTPDPPTINMSHSHARGLIKYMRVFYVQINGGGGLTVRQPMGGISLLNNTVFLKMDMQR